MPNISERKSESWHEWRRGGLLEEDGRCWRAKPYRGRTRLSDGDARCKDEKGGQSESLLANLTD